MITKSGQKKYIEIVAIKKIRANPTIVRNALYFMVIIQVEDDLRE